MLGRLSLDAFKHDAIVMGGVVIMTLAVLAIFGALFYFKRWKWLWKEWMTSVDPKKIGVMYVVVALVMLLRGLSDVIMLRGQQAVASGSQGYLTSDHFQQIVRRDYNVYIPDLFCPWYDYDLFRSHGAGVWFVEPRFAITDWCSRRGFPVYEFGKFLAVCCRRRAYEYIVAHRCFFTRWLVGVSATFRNTI